MAGDGLITAGNLITSRDARKVRRLDNGAIVGCSGEWGLCELIFRWFEGGENPDVIPSVPGRKVDDETAVEVLILRADGTVQLMDDNFTAYPVDCPAAIGAGCEVALGLMLAGKSPREAVVAVSKVVTTVGGEITEETSKGARA